MIGTVADLIESVSKRTGFTPTYITQRARGLQADGSLAVTAGRHQPPAVASDLVCILFALTASKARQASEAASALDTCMRFDDCEPSERYAGNFLEFLVARIWSGNPHGCESITVQSHPAPCVSVKGGPTFYPRSEFTARFTSPKSFVENDRVPRVTLTIPCETVAQIGADLGHKNAQ